METANIGSGAAAKTELKTQRLDKLVRQLVTRNNLKAEYWVKAMSRFTQENPSL